jgi:hypothetical protein
MRLFAFQGLKRPAFYRFLTSGEGQSPLLEMKIRVDVQDAHDQDKKQVV